jgi:hypothetical protein
MSILLDDLSGAMRPLAVELLAKCAESRIPVIIIDTLRTQAEHDMNIANGVSWAQRSRHLDGMAIDIAPEPLVRLKNWAPDHPWWERCGAIGERIGLTWGGRWSKRDLGHFEIG